ncbi:ribosome biogenesis factor YjgA [Pseudoalteromonas sp. T1lg23B]|uniref:ribosome biogenesis factor YjgA n=1 Tax=Pseudoalteromonas sp. T1lg23B TaxID=2077097 RepID=UPI000CF627A6|nr:ribosome biogenesis factor YjgA [Pseudoalteromonas sp. T1lg23B]
MAKQNKPIPDEEIIYVSKSELKRDAQQYHQLAQDLANMPKKQRDKLPLSDDLIEAMVVADKIRQKSEAYRRHINYITKTLRLTENVADIEAAIGLMLNKNKQADVLLNKIELVRDELISQGDSKINELIDKYPRLERQKMRQLVRQASKEEKAQKPAKGYKELFQYLKEAMMP